MDIIKAYLKLKPIPYKKAIGKGQSSDNYLKYCTECNLVWEKSSRFGGETKLQKVIHHEDFPSYGKTRETCLTCLDK